MEGVTIEVSPQFTTDENGQPCIYIPVPEAMQPQVTRLVDAQENLRNAEQEVRSAEDALRQKAIALGVYRGG